MPNKHRVVLKSKTIQDVLLEMYNIPSEMNESLSVGTRLAAFQESLQLITHLVVFIISKE